MKAKKYLYILPVIFLIIGAIGILSHRDQEFKGTFYRVIVNEATRTKTLSSEEIIEIKGVEAIIKDKDFKETQLIDSKEKSISYRGYKYFYNYNTGHLSLTRDLGNNNFETIEFVSKESPMFEAYQKGEVDY
ncbi:TPA: hypothetical protein ACHVE4_002036 [Streptococcus suis]